MNFLPEFFAPWPDLIVDHVGYATGEGTPVTSVGAVETGQELEASVRFYAAFPFAGAVRGVVRRDRPGFQQTDDDILGQETMEVDVDPTDYGEVQRETLTIPFVAEADGALGFYVELYFADDELPWFSTSWDAIYPSGALPFNWATYLDNFGTYGHWPPSLPVTGAAEPTATLFATVRVAPLGNGISGATVVINDATFTAGDNGIAVVEGLPEGEYAISATADGYESGSEGLLKVTVSEGSATWFEFFFHAVPQVALPSPWYAGECSEVTWAVEPFSGQADFFTVQLMAGESSDEVVEELLTKSGSAEFCPPDSPDDASLRVSVRATYLDGTTGVLGWSEPFQVVAELPAEPSVEAVEAPVDQAEWEVDVRVTEEVIGETWETVAEKEIVAEVVEAELGSDATRSSGCATHPTSGSNRAGVLLLAALLLSLRGLRRIETQNVM